MMAACLATGTTQLVNAAREPEISIWRLACLQWGAEFRVQVQMSSQ